MITYQRIGIVGSRKFKNYKQLEKTVLQHIKSEDDEIVSGGAIGADSMGQRFAKERGLNIKIFYPKYQVHGPPATFIRNKEIAANSDLVLAFYSKGAFQQGGTANTIKWCVQLGVPYYEFEEV